MLHDHHLRAKSSKCHYIIETSVQRNRMTLQMILNAFFNYVWYRREIKPLSNTERSLSNT